MEHIDELKSKLRIKKQEYQDLRNEYEIIMQNYKANLDTKREMRKEIKKLYDEFRGLKNGKEKQGTGSNTDTTQTIDTPKQI